MSPRLAFAIDAATKAGRLTLAHFQTGVAVDTKDDSTPVTVADRGAERLLRDLIAEAFPGEQVLGEEEGGNSEIPDRWVLDPIDGTKSFISGVPLYSTLVSYEKGFVPQLGVIFFPALNEIVSAERGEGAFWNGRPCRVTDRDSVKGSILCCGGHRSMKECLRWVGFERLVADALVTRTWSDAYGHVLVATGRADAMVDPVVSLWDLSAVAVVVTEAGGKFTDFNGEPALNGKSRLEAVSSNGIIHDAILEAFRG